MIVTGLLCPGVHRVAGLADDRAVARAVLRVEAAWVVAQAHVGLASHAEARSACEAVETVPLDEDALNEIAVAAEGGGNPVIPLLAAYRRAVTDVHGSLPAAVHRSLTSQDVMDTALALVLRDVFTRLDEDLTSTGDALAELAQRHRDTPVVAHTLTQHALPTTFGARAASWLSGVDDAARHLAAQAALPASYGGAAGTLAAGLALAGRGATDRDATAVLDALLAAWAEELGLELPGHVTHVQRVPVVRAASALTEVTTALGHVANDVLLMSRPEVGEVREPAAEGRGVSSAMPQKQNPVLSVLIKRTALSAPGLLAHVAAGASSAQDERPDGGWHAEWPALRELAVLSATAASHAAELCRGLRVDEARMAANLDSAGTGVLAERLDAVVGAVLGERDGMGPTQRVKTLIREHPHDRAALATALAEEILRDRQGGRHVDAPTDEDELHGWAHELTDPAGYLGLAPALADRAVRAHRERTTR